MHAVLRFLAEEPLLLLMLLLAVGSAFGALRFRSIGLGPAAVLFSAVALSSLAATYDIDLTIPAEVGTLGLVLFTYTVGIVSGPSFFSSLRRGWKPMLMVVGVFVAVGALALGLGRTALGLTPAQIAGTFAGALTNTPALAAATEASGDPVGPTVGYSLAYLFGVIGSLIVVGLLLSRRGDADSGPTPLVNVVVRVDRTQAMGIEELQRRHGGRIVVARVQHGEENPVIMAEEGDVLRRNDLLTVVGPQDEVMEVVDDLGHLSSHNLNQSRDLDYRRITLSNSKLAGRTLGQLQLNEKFRANVTRVRRGDIDFVANRDFIVQLGDRLRVIAPATRIPQISAHLGDSERGLSDINPIGFALGLVVGVAIGLVEIPVPGGGFALGEAAGTLVVGLIFGRLGRIGPVVLSMPHSAATTLSTFGMLTFLAYAGSRAGGGFVSALSSDLGWKVLLLGFILTSISAGLIAVLGARVLRIDRTELAGMIGGANTQPSALAFANERTNFDQRVGVGYALVYPAAMVAKILIAQILAGL